MRILNRLEEVLIAVLMAAATLIIFLTIIQRYATGAAGVLIAYARTWDFTWAQELCIYMFVWMAKFGAAYGVAPAFMSASTCSSTCWGRAAAVRW